MAKGAVLSHRGVISTLQSLLVRIRRLPVADTPPAPASRALLSLPLFHVGGLQQIITPMVTGGTLVFTDGRFDPEKVVEIIENEGVSVWSAVPTMVNRVSDFLERTEREDGVLVRAKVPIAELHRFDDLAVVWRLRV